MSQANEATDISQGHCVTGTLGKCHWHSNFTGHWHFSGPFGHWYIGKVPVAPQCPRPMTFLKVTGSAGHWGKCQLPCNIPGHWGHWHFSGQPGYWAFGKVLVARQSPRLLRPLTFLRVTGSLGLRESTGGPAKSRWPGKVPNHWGHWHFSGSLGHWAFGKVPVARKSPGPLRPLTFLRVTGSLGLWESPIGLAKSWATEATDIFQGHQVIGPLGKRQWPGKVPES